MNDIEYHFEMHDGIASYTDPSMQTAFPFRFRRFCRTPTTTYFQRPCLVHQKRTRLSCHNEMESLDVFELKTRLDAAVEKEDYTTAAKLRDVLTERLLDVRIAVEVANQHFYTAFQNADLSKMRSLWSKGDHVQCIHPLNGCIAGYDSVMESWEAIFTTITPGNFTIHLEDVCVHVADRMAYVTCTEVVHSGRDTGRIQATNIFERYLDKWTIVHHHGSPQGY